MRKLTCRQHDVDPSDQLQIEKYISFGMPPQTAPGASNETYAYPSNVFATRTLFRGRSGLLVLIVGQTYVSAAELRELSKWA